MSRLLPLFALAASGCYAAPPPPAVTTDLGGCHAGAYGARSELTCDGDADCLLCGEREGCGFLTSRERAMLANVACPPPDPERCRGARARCCGGRCVLSLGPPPL